jgi:hypothetical protein
MDQEIVILYAMEYYSAKRINDMVWRNNDMQLEDIMFSEVSQVQKHKSCIFFSYVEDRPKDKHIYKNKDDHLQIQM